VLLIDYVDLQYEFSSDAVDNVFDDASLSPVEVEARRLTSGSELVSTPA
jgi:hypothetical protein